MTETALHTARVLAALLQLVGGALLRRGPEVLRYPGRQPDAGALPLHEHPGVSVSPAYHVQVAPGRQEPEGLGEWQLCVLNYPVLVLERFCVFVCEENNQLPRNCPQLRAVLFWCLNAFFCV